MLYPAATKLSPSSNIINIKTLELRKPRRKKPLTPCLEYWTRGITRLLARRLQRALCASRMTSYWRSWRLSPAMMLLEWHVFVPDCAVWLQMMIYGSTCSWRGSAIWRGCMVKVQAVMIYGSTFWRCSATTWRGCMVKVQAVNLRITISHVFCAAFFIIPLHPYIPVERKVARVLICSCYISIVITDGWCSTVMGDIGTFKVFFFLVKNSFKIIFNRYNPFPLCIFDILPTVTPSLPMQPPLVIMCFDTVFSIVFFVSTRFRSGHSHSKRTPLEREIRKVLEGGFGLETKSKG